MTDKYETLQALRDKFQNPSTVEITALRDDINILSVIKSRQHTGLSELKSKVEEQSEDLLQIKITVEEAGEFLVDTREKLNNLTLEHNKVVGTLNTMDPYYIKFNKQDLPTIARQESCKIPQDNEGIFQFSDNSNQECQASNYYEIVYKQTDNREIVPDGWILKEKACNIDGYNLQYVNGVCFLFPEVSELD